MENIKFRLWTFDTFKHRLISQVVRLNVVRQEGDKQLVCNIILSPRRYRVPIPFTLPQLCIRLHAQALPIESKISLSKSFKESYSNLMPTVQ